MKSGIKCPKCLSCLDVVWIMPRRYYHCWLHKEFYNMVNNELVLIDIEKESGIPNDKIQQMMESYYEKTR